MPRELPNNLRFQKNLETSYIYSLLVIPPPEMKSFLVLGKNS